MPFLEKKWAIKIRSIVKIEKKSSFCDVIEVSYCYLLVLNFDFKIYHSPWILLQAHLQVHHVCFTFTSCHKSVVFRTLTNASVLTLNIINKIPINIGKDFEIHFIVISNASKG